MGKLVTKGVGKMSFDAEIMILTVTFRHENKDTRLCFEEVERQCESFLYELKTAGINPEDVVMRDLGVNPTYQDGAYRAERQVELEAKADKKALSGLLELLKESSGDIIYNVEFRIEETQDKKDALMKAAIKDARTQAELIAASLGTKVLGVDSVNEQRFGNAIARGLMMDGYGAPEFLRKGSDRTPLTDATQIPTIERAEEIEIAWVIE